MNDSLNNVDFSSQIEKVFRKYEPSEPFIKAVEDMNPSNQIDNMIESSDKTGNINLIKQSLHLEKLLKKEPSRAIH